MKKMFLYMAMVCALTLFAGSAWAQHDHMMNGQAPQWYVLEEEHVAPGMITEYEAATKAWIAAIEKAKIPLSFWAMSEENGTYTYIVPIKKFADIDSFSMQWAQAAKLLANDAKGAARQKAIQWSRYTIWLGSSMLDYTPAKPEVDPMTAGYSKSTEFRIRPENEGAFNSVAMKIKALHQKYAIGRGYSVYRGILGVKGPCYVVVWMGKDPGDIWHFFQSQKPEFMKELMPLLDQLYDLAEELTDATSMARPDLSLMPKEMQ